MTNISRRPNLETNDPHWIEWATGVVSAFLVLFMIGWIAWQAVSAEDRPPEFAITETTRRAVAGGYRIEFEIENTGTTTAADVVVRGEAAQGGAGAEAETTFAYVPAGSTVSGALMFGGNMGEGGFTIRVVGYTDP